MLDLDFNFQKRHSFWCEWNAEKNVKKVEKKIFQFVFFGVTLFPISLDLFINFLTVR